MSRQITLPMVASKATRRDPRVTIIYSLPKTGKSTLLSTLPNNLMIDLESGTQFLNAISVNVIGITPPANETDAQFEARMNPGDGLKPSYYMTEVGRAVMEAGRPYDFITIDTVTKLEDMVLPEAAKMYKETPIGKNWDGDDVRILAKGAGYYFIRKVFMDLIERLKKLSDNIILVGHLKDSIIEKNGKEVDAKELDLTGKIKQILCADADAIGYLYRGKDDELLINFKSSEQILCGSRCDHLKGQIVKIAEYDAEANQLINVKWDLVFPDKFGTHE
jgi:hypothetical protein